MKRMKERETNNRPLYTAARLFRAGMTLDNGAKVVEIKEVYGSKNAVIVFPSGKKRTCKVHKGKETEYLTVMKMRLIPE